MYLVGSMCTLGNASYLPPGCFEATWHGEVYVKHRTNLSRLLGRFASAIVWSMRLPTRLLSLRSYAVMESRSTRALFVGGSRSTRLLGDHYSGCEKHRMQSIPGH